MHDAKTSLLRELRQRSVIAEHARVVGHQQRLGGRGNEVGCLVDIDAQRVVIDVAKHGLGAGRENRLEVRDIVERGGDDLVSRAYAGEQQGQMKRRVAGADRRDVPIGRFEKPRDLGLEFLHVAAHSQPPELERSPRRIELLGLQEGREHRHLLLDDGLLPLDAAPGHAVKLLRRL